MSLDLAAEIDARKRLERALLLVLPRVGYHVRPETVKRLAAELRKEGCSVKYADPGRRGTG